MGFMPINEGRIPSISPSPSFTAADPSDQARHATDVEYRIINEQMRQGGKRVDLQVQHHELPAPQKHPTNSVFSFEIFRIY